MGQWQRVADVRLPRSNSSYVAKAATFHNAIKEAVARHELDATYRRNRYTIFPFVGMKQTTNQSADLEGLALTVSTALPSGIDAGLDGGDGARRPVPAGGAGRRAGQGGRLAR